MWSSTDKLQKKHRKRKSKRNRSRCMEKICSEKLAELRVRKLVKTTPAVRPQRRVEIVDSEESPASCTTLCKNTKYINNSKFKSFNYPMVNGEIDISAIVSDTKYKDILHKIINSIDIDLSEDCDTYQYVIENIGLYLCSICENTFAAALKVKTYSSIIDPMNSCSDENVKAENKSSRGSKSHVKDDQQNISVSEFQRVSFGKSEDIDDRFSRRRDNHSSAQTINKKLEEREPTPVPSLESVVALVQAQLPEDRVSEFVHVMKMEQFNRLNTLEHLYLEERTYIHYYLLKFQKTVYSKVHNWVFAGVDFDTSKVILKIRKEFLEMDRDYVIKTATMGLLQRYKNPLDFENAIWLSTSFLANHILFRLKLVFHDLMDCADVKPAKKETPEYYCCVPSTEEVANEREQRCSKQVKDSKTSRQTINSDGSTSSSTSTTESDWSNDSSK